MIESLKKSKLFSGFDKKLLDEISRTASLKTVVSGEIIFYEKDPAASFYIVVDGKVKVHKVSADGKEQILMIASNGDSFAEAALFAGGKYPATAEAMNEGKLIVIHRERFVKLIEKNPNIAINMIARLSELLHKLNKLVEELSLTDINTRLAHYFVNQIEEHHLADHQKIKLTLSEKKSVLASQLGTIPETLSRSFKKLSKEHKIAVNGAEIEILDIAKLYEVAGE